ncbi:hypothetical protein PanWU01x14_085960 [Parasponia andersonii]|uniref:Uncharacterized protein n=1 Tax=Parasponia andersonii TaxID=3476 RepID=A0A2P5D968_PARAD|nr:hypothetical protein PanWU01x14_085960 [Parasponia andersonii]
MGKTCSTMELKVEFNGQDYVPSQVEFHIFCDNHPCTFCSRTCKGDGEWSFGCCWEWIAVTIRKGRRPRRLLPLSARADHWRGSPVPRRPATAAGEAVVAGEEKVSRFRDFVAGDDSGHYLTFNRARWIRLVERKLKHENRNPMAKICLDLRAAGQLIFRKRTIEGLELVPDPLNDRQRYLEDSIV